MEWYAVIKHDDELKHHGIKGQRHGIRRGPPYPLSDAQKSFDPKEILDTKKKDGKIVMTIDRHKSMPLEGVPNSVITHEHNGKNVGRAYYDSKGHKITEIHPGNHGKPNQHKFGSHGEHAHDYIWESGKMVSRKIRELNEDERKENGDIL